MTTYTPTDADVERAAIVQAKFDGVPINNDHRSVASAILTAHHAELKRQGWQMVKKEPILPPLRSQWMPLPKPPGGDK